MRLTYDHRHGLYGAASAMPLGGASWASTAEEGYDEPEILSFICEWLDPWNGSVTEDDLWDWENNSTIDYLQLLLNDANLETSSPLK